MNHADIQRRLATLPEPERVQHRYRMLRSSLALYATEVLRGPAQYDGRFLIGAHHLQWSQAVSRESRILALAARDHGKSYFYDFAYPIWQAHIRSPGKEGYVISATDDQAKDHLRRIKEEVCGGGELGPNPKLRELLPLRKESEREIVFANGSRIKARGFGSRVRGAHPWWVVGDDLLNDEHVWSETVRQKAVDYFLSAIEPMVVPGGQLIVVGTPFHAEDLYKHLERNGVYYTMKHPAVDPVTGAALWPARYDETALGRKKKILGSALRWSREYLCQPITDDASIFPSWLFEQPGIKQPYPLGLDARYWNARGFTTYAGVDLAISTSANADYFVMFIVAVAPNGDVWVVDILRGQGVGYQEQIDTIISAAKTYDCQYVFVESNQFQRVITDAVIRESSVPVKAFYTTGRGGSRQATTIRRGMAGEYSANKNALDRGVPGLRMLMENRKLRIPWAPETRERVQLWLSEMTSFSFVQGKLQGVGAHDDTVMAFWMAERAAALGGGVGVYFDDHGTAEPIKIEDYDPAKVIAAFGQPPPPAAPVPREDEDEDEEFDFFGVREHVGIPGLPGLDRW